MSSPKTSRFIAFASERLERYGIDFLNCRVQAKDGSGPQGGFILHWAHDGKSGRLGFPHDLSNQGEIRIFDRTLEKQMMDAGIEIPKEDVLKKELETLKTVVETQAEEIKELKVAVDSATDLALEKASEIEGLTKEVQRIAGAFQTILSVKAPEPIPQPTILAAPQPPQITKVAPKAEQKPTGVEALEQVRRNQWAQVVAQMDEEFEPFDQEGRVLFFLEQCGPIEAHWLREAGIWEGLGQVVSYLEGLADKGLAFRNGDRRWAITDAGRKAIEPTDEVIAPVPLPPAPFFQRTPKLIEAPAMPEQPRLTVVAPTEAAPRTLAPAPIMNDDAASPRDALLLYLAKHGPKTTSELKLAGLKGYPSAPDDIGNMAYSTKVAGLIANKSRGGAWDLTSAGKTRVKMISGSKDAVPAKNTDLRKQFVR